MFVRIPNTSPAAITTPPSIVPDPPEIPVFAKGLDARWISDQITLEMHRLMKPQHGVLLGGYHTDGEIVEVDDTAYELHWLYTTFDWPKTVGSHANKRSLLAPIAHSLANFFMEQCELRQIVACKLAPLKVGRRSACSIHRFMRIRTTLCYKETKTFEGNTVTVDGLFGSQMLGTPESARRLMSLTSGQREPVPRAETEVGAIRLSSREEHLLVVEDGNWSGQPLVATDN